MLLKTYGFIIFAIYTSNLMGASLEENFIDQVTCEVDTRSIDRFDHFLRPNEFAVGDKTAGVKPHLDLLERDGLLISTGTERSFFDLILCEKCTGLVVRDVNPKVKAYVDFNIMLLRVSQNLEEYQVLSRPLKSLSELEDIKNKIFDSLLKSRLDIINFNIKQYYIKNFDNFAEVYFKANLNKYEADPIVRKLSTPWRYNEQFSLVDYSKNHDQFLKLQQMARSGSIIATIGDIGDLAFLNHHRIIAIDASNISNYQLLKLNLNPNSASNPRLIWTRAISVTNFIFYSFIPTILNSEEIKAFDQCLDQLIRTKKIDSYAELQILLEDHGAIGHFQEIYQEITKRCSNF